jgi:hypothetical protein
MAAHDTVCEDCEGEGTRIYCVTEYGYRGGFFDRRLTCETCDGHGRMVCDRHKVCRTRTPVTLIDGIWWCEACDAEIAAEWEAVPSLAEAK